jgi:hypothetical protein
LERKGSPDLPDGREFGIPVNLRPLKYFAFPETQISRMVHAVPRSMRGRIAVVTKREQRDAMDVAGISRRVMLATDGEGVWS